MTQSQIVIYAGVLVGAFALLSVCVVWLRKQVMGMGGSTLALIGVILMGLSIWKNVDLSIGKDGIDAKFQALQEQVGQVAAATRTVGESVQKVAAAREADQTRVADLVASLHPTGAASNGSVNAFRLAAVQSPVDLKALESANQKLMKIEHFEAKPAPPEMNAK